MLVASINSVVESEVHKFIHFETNRNANLINRENRMNLIFINFDNYTNISDSNK